MQLQPAARVVVELTSSSEFMVVLPATHECVVDARQLLEQWLRGLRWPGEESMNILVAVNQVLQKLADQPPQVESASARARLYAWEAADSHRGERRIIVTVTHSGWSLSSRCRESTRILSGYLQSVHIEPTARGTSVVMCSRPVAGSQRHTDGVEPSVFAVHGAAAGR